MIDYKAIEEKWLAEWEGAKLFEAEPNDKDSVLVTAAWPYTYIPQPIGKSTLKPFMRRYLA